MLLISAASVAVPRVCNVEDVGLRRNLPVRVSNRRDTQDAHTRGVHRERRGPHMSAADRSSQHPARFPPRADALRSHPHTGGRRKADNAPTPDACGMDGTSRRRQHLVHMTPMGVSSRIPSQTPRHTRICRSEVATVIFFWHALFNLAFERATMDSDVLRRTRRDNAESMCASGRLERRTQMPFLPDRYLCHPAEGSPFEVTTAMLVAHARTLDPRTDTHAAVLWGCPAREEVFRP